MDIQELLDTDQFNESHLSEAGINYSGFMSDYNGSAHKVGFIKFFVYELSKLGTDLSYKHRRKILLKGCYLTISRTAIYLADYELAEFFHNGRLVDSYSEKVTERFSDYNKQSLTGITSVHTQVSDRSIKSIQEGFYDNLSLALKTQQDLMSYWQNELIPLLSFNLLLRNKTPNKVASELSLSDAAAYIRNTEEIERITANLTKFMNPSAITRYAHTLGVQFETFGEDSNVEVTPANLIISIEKALAARSVEPNLLREGLPDVIDELGKVGVGLGEHKLIGLQLSTSNDEDNTNKSSSSVITAENMTKEKGHRSLYDNTKYEDNNDMVFTEYSEGEETDQPELDLGKPPKDSKFIGIIIPGEDAEDKEENLDDVLY
jgi:hypothetical protein